MSDLQTAPDELVCRVGDPCTGVVLLEPRDVPLGGTRAMDVRRTLPQRSRSLIGAWCFLDHYGPDRVSATGGMNVPRHPHTGLQTVSWLFTGEIEHRDSAGFEAIVRPGELNLMTAGRGISHSEFSTPGTEVLHGVQLWLALPDRARGMEPTFEHYAPEPVHLPGRAPGTAPGRTHPGEAPVSGPSDGEGPGAGGAELRVFLGELAGSASPVTAHHPTVGAEILIDAGASVSLDLDPDFEHGVLLDAGDLAMDGHIVPGNHLAYLPTGRTAVVLSAGERPVRAVLIGGAPMGERIIMWWNFVGREHDEIVAYRRAWQAEIGAEPAEAEAAGSAAAAGEYDDGAPYPRFGVFGEGTPPPLPAPTLPNVRLRPRDQ
ncbi:pirin family protein [Zhihengliuella sp.]|uniref:pirin family protein n=1 Tax=Zhihengliuella sp. TaxID=1954483 RepID=UPI002812240F|nr:pirin family protein [Zhihengliuella sp.]